MLHSIRDGLAVVVFACSVATPVARAQCQPFALPGDGLAGADGAVFASVAWDPDGAGPLPPRWVLGGDFAVAGDRVANHVVAWDPATSSWSEFGAGVDATVKALAVLANGDLVAASRRLLPTGLPECRVHRWDGATWQLLGSFTHQIHAASTDVQALLVLANGDLVVGGYFTAVGATAVANAARWNGATWQPMGQSAAFGTSFGVTSLAVTSTGTVVAGSSSVQAWNGTDWTALGAPFPVAVRALWPLANGELFAGVDGFGVFGTPVQRGVRHWDGVAWSDAATAPAVPVRCFTELANGDVVLGGDADAAGAAGVARWNGSTWSPMPQGLHGGLYTLAALPNGDLLAGGAIARAGTHHAHNLVRLAGGAWTALGDNVFGEFVAAMATLSNGDLLIGGELTSGRGLARWDGATWTEIPSPPGSNYLLCTAERANGDLVVGNLTLSGGDVLEIWNGASWSSVPSVLARVDAVLELPGGGLAVTGGQGIDVWDGAGWTTSAGRSRSATPRRWCGCRTAIWSPAATSCRPVARPRPTSPAGTVRRGTRSVPASTAR